jgi:hypothetical protein
MKLYLLELFAMDVERMTPADWLGVVLTVITFVALAIAYFKVFHPKNKDSLESHRYHLIDHDRDVPYWGSERRQARVRHK